jgi:prolyl 4-hydroxylase
MDYEYLTQHVFLVRGFLTPAECGEFITLAEGAGFEEASINSAFGQVRAPEVRNNDRVIRDDADLAARLWPWLETFVPKHLDGGTAIGLNERWRFYRYGPGHVFRWHRDGAFERSASERSRLTFMIYLNEGFTGGATRFEAFEVQPEAGMALVFYHPLLHEGGEIVSGTKYVLRSDVMYRQDPEFGR